MQAAVEFAPWIIFGLTYKFAGGLYPATAALMVAIALPLAHGWLRERKVKPMHLWLAVLVWVFGAATLILHDVRFLQWKASIYYWLFGIALLGSTFIGKATLLERIMSKPLAEGGVTLTTRTWRQATLLLGLLNLVFGLANIWVALNRSEEDWVTFKVWILTPVALVLTLAIFGWLLRDVLFPKKTHE
ncbi:MAG TPA: septation protein IspZ [Steroidobacteraceae bacterium]|jgi:intracellular septation protein